MPESPERVPIGAPDSSGPEPLRLGLFSLWCEEGPGETTLRTAELAARTEAALLVECVFDVRAAEVRVPTGYGPFVGVYAEDSSAAKEAQTHVRRFERRVVEVCARRCTVADAQALVARPSEALEALAERADAIALSSADFHELCQWYRPKTPFHVVQEQQTPVLIVKPTTQTVGESALVVDVETTVSDPVEHVAGPVSRLVSELAPVSAEIREGGPSSWQTIESWAARAEHDTVVVHPTQSLSLPLIGKHSRLRHAIDETNLAVWLV